MATKNKIKRALKRKWTFWLRIWKWIKLKFYFNYLITEEILETAT